MQRLFLSALALSLCGCGSAYCAPALSLAPTRPMILVRRTSPLLACATNEPPEQHAKIVASPSSNAATAWIEQNLLQGVNLNPSTYAVMVVYFVQGVLGLASLARTYFLKDQLGLSPAEATALMGITTLPWVIKPVYGFLSDGLPIFGYRRKPYLIIAGLLGSASWTSLATVVSTPTQAVVAATVASLGVAVSDVVVDSLVVERAREDETASSGALQSLCWSCQSLGALTSAYFSGSLLQTMSPQQVFAITAVFPLLVVLMALQLDEKRVVKTAKDTANGEGVSAGPFADFSELVSSQGSLLWGAISQRQVWLPTLFIALWQATPTSDGAFFYFITDELGIGPEFLGRVRVGTSLASLFGIWAYRTYLQEVELKKLFTGLSVAGAVLGSTQLLLVSRYNLVLGIPDTWFTFGDDLILTVLGQLSFMPLLVLAAALCPPGVEGTLFALLMSVFNGAGIIGTELGALLTEALGVSAEPGGGPTDFTNLGLLVTLCNLSSLLPLLALGLLDEVPQPPPEDGANADVIDHEGASAAPTAALQTGATPRVSASGAVNPSSTVSDEQAVEER